jgi:peptide-methionine (S)-S-oxide reductase
MKSYLPTTITLLALMAALGVGAFVANPARSNNTDEAMTDNKTLAKATFAGGCFWCMEPPFDKLDGVISSTSGYIGGQKKDPTYEEVSAGVTGHTEAVEIVYDSTKVGYEKLLEVFWRNIDPTTANRQFCDVGSQYRTGIFYHDEEQKKLAEKSKRDIDESGKLSSPIVTEITEATEFYPAEDYHQDYYKKNPIRYKYYRFGCGRDDRLDELWGDES